MTREIEKVPVTGKAADYYSLTGMSRITVLILFFAVCCSACAAPIRDIVLPDEKELSEKIYLVSHGWHAGIVLQRAGIPASVQSVFADFSDAEYLEVGWGDRDYYQTPDPHTGLILKAALLPTASVLHIVGFSGPVQTYFPNSEIIRIELSSAAFTLLVEYIAKSFARDESGNIRPLGPGLYGNSRFYLSAESYHLFNTCNVWTARALHAAGLPVTPARAIRVKNLMSQAQQLGTVIQIGPNPSE